MTNEKIDYLLYVVACDLTRESAELLSPQNLLDKRFCGEIAFDKGVDGHNNEVCLVLLSRNSFVDHADDLDVTCWTHPFRTVSGFAKKKISIRDEEMTERIEVSHPSFLQFLKQVEMMTL